MRITSCKINHLKNPLGFAMEKAVFSWTVEESTGKRQAAARIRVCCGKETVADTGWENLDSLATKVAIPWKPRTRYVWTVAVRSDAGEEAVSEENWFETGLNSWQAAWIGCEDEEPRHPIFSKPIAPKKEVSSARLYICGLGLYEARWNGEKIGEEYLTPYCNNYHRWVQYQTFDITRQLQTDGILDVELGNGWYKGRFGYHRNPIPHYGNSWKLLAQVVLTYADGTEDIIGTDETWSVTRSNIYFSNIYDGEQQDDTLAPIPAVPARLTDAPEGKLVARSSTPVQAWETLPVKERIHTPAGETVLDVGQNMTGSFRLSVHEPKGTKIHLQFGEVLQGGNFYRDNLRSALAEYIYISDGEPHVLEPKFTFYGYRYVKVQGISNLKPEDFTALVLYSQLPQTGFMTTGSKLVNQLISNVIWGQKGNFLDVPTDCPQRDERMGWTGDAQVFSGTACYLRDSAAFLSKYLQDIASEQAMKNGMVPDVVPGFGCNKCSCAWGDAACVIPMKLYEMYGDKAILEQQFESMKAWVGCIRNLDGDNFGWRKQFHYGDWLALDGSKPDDRLGGTEEGYIADILYRHSVLLVAEAARILGKTEEETYYSQWADHLLQRIRAEFFSATGRCAIPTQTGYLLALLDGNAPDEARIFQDLEENLRNSRGKLKTGFVGTPLLCPTLTKYGDEKAAFRLLLNEEYPGWLYSVKSGATTVWERWNSLDENGIIAENGMNSLNHYAYGAIVEWMFRDVAGIAPAAPGFRKANLCPHMDISLGKAETVFHSAAGTWETAWEILPNGDISYRCRVPFGCEAQLKLPCGGGEYALTAGEFKTVYTPIPLPLQ